MKTIFDPAIRAELIRRIQSVNDHSQRQWGNMNVYQMLKHCTLWEEMVQNGKAYKQVLLGRIFGRMALRSLTKDERPLGRNAPTIPELKVHDVGEVSQQKAAWIRRLEGYAYYDQESFAHPFFGRMTREQVGYLAYKHADHHLRQFNH